MGEGGPVGQKLAIALAFGSSAAVMVLELVSLRLVAPYIGLTLETNTAVIGVALAAIATGAALGGRFADVVPPQRTLGPLFLLSGALVMLILPVVRWTGEALRGGGNELVFLVLAVTLFAPASLLAAVTPMVTKLRLDSLAQTGTVVGRLSAYATVGGIVGTVLTGFVFVATVPTSTIILTLGATLVVVGAALTFLLRGVQAAVKPVALAVVGATLTLVAPRPCEVETAYHCARVVADPNRESGRTLYLDQARHSYVDLKDPTYLEFEYIKSFAAAINGTWAEGQPLNALHVGGGGLTMPRYLTATRPGSKHQVYEIDKAVVELDKRELGVQTGPDLVVTVEDGRLGVRDEETDSRDLVIMDAFSGLSVPWHLTTRELVSDVRRVLRPDGLYLINVIDYGAAKFAKAEIKTAQAQFPYVAVIARKDELSGHSGGNFVVAASDKPIDVPGIVGRLEPSMGVLDPPDGFVGDAPVLTDDYAPVDQLLTPHSG
ncbi:fused MFS/spermidine synthase [Kribbella sindirgiensis]|uniref:Spermidine synthase n=1 Tax=Kribbella sindirgiensis TaxID=1124744 RepID=A0A4R0I4F4_9ACTN|nr:fused MFS/spermidine synthase [Kribbella sindirgiensis]TCC19318.1 spermidine synthase [Kribbella sindirgiensis]